VFENIKKNGEIFMKKTLTVLLALAMLSSAVMTSCSDATDNAETTAASS
jgi:hypothetical protein